MDENKNTQGQQGQGQNAEGSRDETRGNMGSQERGTGRQGEKNSSGTSNRSMNDSEEQADLPDLDSGSDDYESGQSER